jgi:lipopolysaccharide export system protein LptA
MTAGNRRRASLALALLCTAACAPAALAEKADRDKPINYQADAGDVNYQTKVGTLIGNVVITQGTLTIHADKVILRQNPDNSLSATAFGNPLTFREKSDNSDQYYDGVAQRAEYDGQKRFLELFDRALLRKGTDEIRSNYISYNAETEFFKAEGRPDTRPPGAGEPPLGARVRGIFTPQPKDEKTAKSDKGTKDEKAPKDDKGAKDDKSAKDNKAAKDEKTAKDDKTSAESKPAPPLSLKPDNSIDTAPAK